MLAFLEKIRGSTVTFYTDSQNAASIILKGSRIPELQVLALTIFNSYRKKLIDIYTVWIPRGQNVQADYLSRIIDIEFYSYLDSMWGPHSVDRFANVDNRKKFKRFNSLYWNPGTLGVDAFNSNWSSEVNWLVPPVSLASRAINHLVECKA